MKEPKPLISEPVLFVVLLFVFFFPLIAGAIVLVFFTCITIAVAWDKLTNNESR